ncbi:MAG: hypothetical protein ACYDBA_05450 [Sulfuricaulis sp.]
MSKVERILSMVMPLFLTRSYHQAAPLSCAATVMVLTRIASDRLKIGHLLSVDQATAVSSKKNPPGVSKITDNWSIIVNEKLV